MKKLYLLLIVAIALTVVACKQNTGSDHRFNYPDFGYANADSDSWLQKDNEVIDVNWFVDMSYFGTAAIPGTKVHNKILEKTGVNVRFLTPITDDGTQLSTMIAGNKLPDIVTVSAGSSNRVQLAEEGYTYPIQELATRYAPSLLPRLKADVQSYFKQSDGNIYGLPNHFYTQSDMAAYQEQEGRNLLPNGAMVARKDYLDAYMAANPGANPTTPAAFLDMCLWVKYHFGLSNTNPTFLLNHFGVTGSNAIQWIREYFAVPRESASGQLIHTYGQDLDKEAFMFLNELYRNRLINQSNFTAGSGAIGNYIAQGLPFIYLGSPQEYTMYFKQAFNAHIEYVPIVITNSHGDVPQLRSLAGNAWLFSMITTKAKRPDRIIKLFDYLWSEEGQSLFYGIKGEDWDYEIEPGQVVTKMVDGVEKSVTYIYGKAKYKDNVWNDIQNDNVSSYGFGYSNQLVNPMYPRLTGRDGEVLNSYTDYLDYNRKATLIDYTFYIGAFEFTRDATHSNYTSIVNKSRNITNLWLQYIPRIISASSSTEAESIYNQTVTQSIAMGANEVLAFDNVYFQKAKEALGITYAWPPNDPLSVYHTLTLTSIYGNTSYILPIPDDIRIH